jgi:hypothetical protein
MIQRIAVLAIAMTFLTAPALGAVAMDSCSPCCTHPVDVDPCETGDAPCVSIAAEPCCEVAPAAPVLPAKRLIEPPSFQPAAAAHHASAAIPQRARPLRNTWHAALRPLPLRLSVILLI